jgi:hypothetical protein
MLGKLSFKYQSAKFKISPSLKECPFSHFVNISKWIYRALLKRS